MGERYWRKAREGEQCDVFSPAVVEVTREELLAEMGGVRVRRCSVHHRWWDDPEDAGCIEGVRYGEYLRCDQDEVVWIVKEAADG